MPKLQSKKILASEPQFLAIPDHYVNLVGKIAYANLAYGLGGWHFVSKEELKSLIKCDIVNK